MNKLNKSAHAGVDPVALPVSIINLPAAINILGWPDDVIMALAHSGHLRADLSATPPIFNADDVIELAASIEHFAASQQATIHTHTT